LEVVTTVILTSPYHFYFIFVPRIVSNWKKVRFGEVAVPKQISADKGIDNRARQLSTPEAHLARPNYNTKSKYEFMSYVDIVIYIGSLPILEAWPSIYRGQEGTVRDRLKESQVLHPRLLSIHNLFN
jgi:hypothetical protein